MNRLLGAAAMVALFAVILVAGPFAIAQDTATPVGSPMASPAASPGVGMTGTGAAYMTIANAGGETDRLVGGTTTIARVVEIHEIVPEGDVMRMRPLADGLEIPAGGEETLEPGGYHVMLIGLTEDLNPDMTFDLTLQFERAGEVTVPVGVRMQAEPADGEAESITVGELTLTNPWSRPAPAIGGGVEATAAP